MVKVQLYRYDLTQGMAAQLSPMILGQTVEAVWHTAIVVYGQEFYFDGGVGITAEAPGTTRFGRPVRVDDLGDTDKTADDFVAWNATQMIEKYGGDQYDLMQRNCNHYSNDAALFLVGAPIDASITGQVDTLLSTPLGMQFRPMLEQMSYAQRGAPVNTQQFAAPQAPSTSTAQPTVPPPSTVELKAVLKDLETCDAERVMLCLGTVQRVVTNLVAHPNETKFHRISSKGKTFSDTIAQVPLGPKILESMGFVLQSDGVYAINMAKVPASVAAEFLALVEEALSQAETTHAVAMSLMEDVAPNVCMDPPQSEPIRSIEALLAWKPDGRWRHREPPRLQRRPSTRTQPPSSQLLLCHDFMGGYVDGDKHVQGGSTATSVYTVEHWENLDMFCYFAHHRVSIPPISWVRAARRHGVPIIGTFITEWDEGKKECAKLLSDTATMMKAVHKLCEVASFYHFDGWLINIENSLTATQVSFMTQFVAALTTEMHRTVPNSTVMWYDAVTTEGNLQWQNALTPLNEPFFNVCDALFTNYTWNENALNVTVRNAGPRKSQVFTGIDCFGRNTYGGGEFNCNIAFEAIHKAGTSTALFAPGWTMESTANKSRGEFLQRDMQFWLLLTPFVDEAGQVRQLPFSTTFNTGVGQRYNVGGSARDAVTTAWCDLSQQDVKVRSQLLECSDATLSTEFADGDSFDGPTSLHLAGSLHNNTSHASVRILELDSPYDTTQPIVATVAHKVKDGAGVGVTFFAVFAGRNNNSIVMLHPEGYEAGSLPESPGALTHVSPATSTRTDGGWVESTFVLPQSVYPDGGMLCTFSCVVGSVAAFLQRGPPVHAAVKRTEFLVLVGKIGISQIPLSKTIQMKATVRGGRLLSVPQWPAEIDYYNVFCGGRYKGRSYDNDFVVCGTLMGPDKTGEAAPIEVQPVDRGGRVHPRTTAVPIQ